MPFTTSPARASSRRTIHGLLVAGALLTILCIGMSAQRGPGPGGAGPLPSLKTVPRPQPTDVDRFVRDQQQLVALGKALFWDVQAGSDGRTACASCHFHAGADHRRQNQLASPHDAVTALRPNLVLTIDDYPFRRLANPLDNRSAVVSDRRLVTGSAGIARHGFLDVVEGSAFDESRDDGVSTPFALGGVKVRQVTARNAPSVINAVFNVRNFWDGRASRVFSGATPFGDSDTGFNVLTASGDRLLPERVRLEDASLASQSVGPALDEVEMSFAGRGWAKLGRKLLSLPPLARQQVATDDSVLGDLADPSGSGLRPEVTYASLIQAAFRPAYWESPIVVDANGRVLEGLDAPRNSDEFRQIEFNFAVFWGLAIQAYEATLVSDDAPIDRFAEGNPNALTALQQAGLQEFVGGGSQCTQCHQGPEFTAAAFTNVARGGFDASSLPAQGFFRTGVSAASDDIGAGGRDGFGLPFFAAVGGGAATGAFKSPGLRNVALTGPYFHDGGMATMGQVIDFYARQGDFAGTENIAPEMGRIRLNPQDRAALVAFMDALTDDRVKFERAPFDHPSLCLPTGYDEPAPNVVSRDASSAGGATALDRGALIPATGRGGNSVPLQTFEELLRGIGNDGSRAHTLTTPCQP